MQMQQLTFADAGRLEWEAVTAPELSGADVAERARDRRRGQECSGG
jgi:hypothetical protein